MSRDIEFEFTMHMDAQEDGTWLATCAEVPSIRASGRTEKLAEAMFVAAVRMRVRPVAHA